MCGIAGVVRKNDNLDLESDIVSLKNNLIHRGPDHQNSIINKENNFAFCSARLSIIDLVKESNQPQISDTGNIISFNGEIYNYLEIKKNLIKKKIKFKTNSDTEVILKGYEVYGENIVHILEGMFAFVIWDEKKKIFFGARDIFGIKPLAYYLSKEKFIFSSELKPIHKILDQNNKLSNQSILNYFIYGVVNQPASIFDGINFLLPGNFFILDKELNLKVVQYYSIDKSLQSKVEYSTPEEYHEEFFKLLEEAVSSSMISDVPISVFLSGGVDSTIILNTLSNQSKKNLNSSINIDFGYNNKDYPDRKILNQTNKVDHYRFKINSIDILNEMNALIDYTDQPSYDGLNTFIASKKVFSKNKVVLSGLGSDEMFFGYNIINDFISSRTINLKNIIFNKLYKIKPLTFFQSGYFLEINEKNFLLNLRKIIYENYEKKFKKDFLKSTSIEQLENDVIKNYNENLETLEQRLFSYEIKNYLLNTLLRDSDNMSMANSIELRPCFLTKKLVEFSARTINYSRSISKKPKNSLKKYYESIFKTKYTKKKYGFEPPYKTIMPLIFKNYKLQGSEILNLFFKRQYLTWLDENCQNKNYSTSIYSLYLFDQWVRRNNFKLKI